jgi:hypothetical protein
MNSMPPRIRLLVLAPAWAGATFGVLALERIPGDYAHDYCGPWGCLPPVQALVAMHGFWLLLMVPLAGWLLGRASPGLLRLAGAFAFWAGVLGLAVVMGRGLLGWLDATGSLYPFAVRHMLYVAVTATDLPFAQAALTGIVLWLVGCHRTRAGRVRTSGQAVVAEMPSSLSAASSAGM